MDIAILDPRIEEPVIGSLIEHDYLNTADWVRLDPARLIELVIVAEVVQATSLDVFDAHVSLALSPVGERLLVIAVKGMRLNAIGGAFPIYVVVDIPDPEMFESIED